MSDRHTIIFGTGSYGKIALDIIGKEQIAFFADNDKVRWGERIKGIEVISLDELYNSYSRYRIVIAIKGEAADSVRNQLEEKGIYHAMP